MLKAKLLAGGGAETLYVDDVFSAYTYTGNGSTQTITNGIDLAGKGGMVWVKFRSAAYNNVVTDTTRGVKASLSTNLTAAEQVAPAGDRDLYAFTSSGFSVGTDYNYNVNTNATTFASWTFRKAPRFFSQSAATVTGGADATVSFSDLATLGMVIVKRTDSTGSWYVWHRSLTAGKLLYLEQTAAEATLGHITVSGTTVTLEGGVIANGTYIVYAWAHDTATDGLIQCGSFTTDGSGVIPAVNLGWEPQFLLTKASNAATNWYTNDVTRSLGTDSSALSLYPNASANEEGNGSFQPKIGATGITGGSWQTNKTVIYLAIRRPNKPPTVGTQVYNAIARTGTGAAVTVTGVGFAPDLFFCKDRTQAINGYNKVGDRLRGASAGGSMRLDATAAETTDTLAVTSFNMDGFSLGTDATIGSVNWNAVTYINHFFKRAPGVFDVVCYTGTGVAHTEAHSLGVAPELIIVKSRSNTENWFVYSATTGNTYYLLLNGIASSAGPSATVWNSTTPTQAVFSLGTAGPNTNAATYVAYLFATKAGISKVGSYTGNGSSLTLNMGFTTGARFFLCKRTDSTGDWYVFDTTRGIIAGNDGHLSLNTIAAEVTTDDSVDPDTSGLIVNQLAATNINVNAATYIYLAFA